MNIAHIITGLPKAAGTTTFVENVAREQRALGHDVVIVTQGDFASFLVGTPPDVIHIHALWSRMLHQAAVFARKRNIPVIWSTHGMTAPWSLQHKWWKKCLPWYLIQRHDLKRADRIHCTTLLEEQWNQALGFSKTFIVPLGTTIPVEGLQACETLAELEPKTLLYVGRIYSVKALDNLIKAFSIVIKKGQSAHSCKLRLVGPDQAGHMAELMALCEQLNLIYSKPSEERGDAQVQFVGPKFADELAKEYAQCTALALVSHTENFGATVVDAMAHGKPVVTSTQTPWREVQFRGCGWWVDNSIDSLVQVLTEFVNASVSDLLKMGKKGRAWVERDYSWSVVASKLSMEYLNI